MTPVKTLTRLIALLCIGGVFPSVARAQTIVWTDGNARNIQKKDVSGGPVQTIVQFPSSGATEIHYDSIAAKFYYRFGTNFQRSNADGTNPENISTPSQGPFAINIESRMLFWSTGFSNVLHYSDLNGTGAASHTYPTCCFTPVLSMGENVYLGGSIGVTKGIWRAEADGSNELLLHTSGAPNSAAYDPIERKLYVATDEDIYRLNTDGSGFQWVIPSSQFRFPEHVVVDYKARKLYWASSGDLIQRSNLDGSNVEDFVTKNEVGNPNLDIRGLTIVDSPTIPATSAWGVLATVLLILVFGMIILKKRMAAQSQFANS